MANEILSPNYILPDNDVWLLKGVPLENNYEDTIIWQVNIGVDGSTISGESVEQAKERQFNYFTATVGQSTRYNHLRLPAMTYLREGRKYLRVDLPYTRAIQYNYLIFKNNGAYTVGESTTAYHYEHRYYYAFITNFEYINDKTTLIHYEIDLMQTYNFDYELKQCFVEREHTSTDNKFEHNIPEKVEAKEFTYNDLGLHSSFQLINYKIIIAATFKGTWNPATLSDPAHWTFTDFGGGFQGGIYSGLYYNVMPSDLTMTEVDYANQFLVEATDAGKRDGIVSVFMMPDGYISSSAIVTNYTWKIANNSALTDSWTYTYTENGITKTGPRNNKLYSMPFTSIIIYNGNGDIGEYGMQFFYIDPNDPCYGFIVAGQCSPTPEFSCIPANYKNMALAYTEKTSINTMPQCAYAIDSYRAWLAQNKGKIVTSIASGIGSTMLGIGIGRPFLAIGSSVSTLRSIENFIAEGYQASILAPQAHGTQTPSLSVASGELGFHAYTKRPTVEYARIIDDYFDLYGYATNEVKIPNRTVRPSWCYTKTVGCRLNSINRGIPADVDDAIRKIYDNGIRFWKDPAKIGNYTYSNAPVAVIP